MFTFRYTGKRAEEAREYATTLLYEACVRRNDPHAALLKTLHAAIGVSKVRQTVARRMETWLQTQRVRFHVNRDCSYVKTPSCRRIIYSSRC